jgi:hypothetical protein
MGFGPTVISHLAWGALRSMTLRAWRFGAGDESFVESFRPEGLVPLTGAGRAIAPLAGRCTGCGACEYPGCSPRSVLEACRGLQDLRHASERVRVLAGLDPTVLDAMERSCPAHIPFGRIADHLGHMLDTGPKLS